MPTADTARLIASLELGRNTLGPGIDRTVGSLGKLEGRLGRIGGLASQGFASAAGNIAKLGAIGLGGLGLAVKTGLDDLAKLESATTSVDGAIKTLGLTGQLTSKQVARWANDIERDVGAAFDDKDIVSASATLLRFGKVTPANLRPALVVMTDLAAKTGDVDSAASLLAKALADPEKAAGKLARQGIVLTRAQQDQLKAMVRVGDVAGAQAFLLDRVAESTKGAAAASQGPYRRAISLLTDASEDARKALATGFLPVIEKVADRLSRTVADPKALASIEGFGKTLAGALDSAIETAQRIPWGTIGEGMKLAGAGAKTALEFFTKLPPWVQTAVVTGWGLNKLTGGALGGIVGELGKGLVKGVLGMNAGVVNINAGVVNGGGGSPIPGKVPPVVGAAEILGGLGATGAVAVVIAGITAAAVATLGLELGKVNDGARRAQEGRDETARARQEASRRGGPPARTRPIEETRKVRFPTATEIAKAARTGGLSPDERQERNDQAKKIATALTDFAGTASKLLSPLLHPATSGGLSPDERQERSDTAKKLDQLNATTTEERVEFVRNLNNLRSESRTGDSAVAAAARVAGIRAAQATDVARGAVLRTTGAVYNGTDRVVAALSRLEAAVRASRPVLANRAIGAAATSTGIRSRPL